MNIIELLKKIPIDFGQGSMRNKTMGKLIAFSLTKEGKNKKALDVGCRDGRWSELLKNKGYQVSSIDIKKEYQDCILMDANKRLLFDDSTFDLVWCSEVIEHLNDPFKAIQEFRRITKPKGQIIITTPNSYFWLFNFLSFFGLPPHKLQTKYHKHFFDLKDINKIFPDAEIYGFFPYFLLKFKITKLAGLLSPTFVVYLANNK